MINKEGFVRRHAVGVYFGIAFAISWSGSVLGLGPGFLRGGSVLIAWVYANTESVLLGQLMHASSTGFLGVLVPIGIGGSYWASFYTVYAVVLWGAVVFVVARYGEKLVRVRGRDA